MQTITIPCYLLDDSDIYTLIERSEDVMTELAGESPTPELPTLITQLRSLLKERQAPIKLEDIIFGGTKPRKIRLG